MVVQVGDKVLVYGAGTPWAFAKKIEPVEVGDKVDVVTLSDGTKLAMPKIELDLSEYVWVVPEFDTPFNIGDVPFQWGMMPLGAAVFTITAVTDCYRLEDSLREWDPAEIIGKKLIVFRSVGRGYGTIIFTITGWDYPNYSVVLDYTDLSYDLWTDMGVADPTNYYPAKSISPAVLDLSASWGGARGRSKFPLLISPAVSLAGIKKIQFSWLYKSKYAATCWDYIGDYCCRNHHPQFIINGTDHYQWRNYCLTVKKTFHEGDKDIDYRCNPGYPKFTTETIPASTWGGLLNTSLQVMLCGAGIGSLSQYYCPSIAMITGIMLIPSGCQTENVLTGDRYLILDPDTNRLVLNDGAKTVLGSAYWRDISGPDEEITTAQVQYAWDGAGQVYLSQSKTTLSTIFYDNELQVSNTAAGTTKTIPYHTNDPYTLEGETVSRELVNITSILRAGNNEITLSVRDTTGNKIGFPTPVYIMRSMS